MRFGLSRRSTVTLQAPWAGACQAPSTNEAELAETLHQLLCHHLCSEPMDFTYYSIRRFDIPHGGEQIGLMIDGREDFSYI